jgi:membrane protein DedA with SNARE-associated domain
MGYGMWILILGILGIIIGAAVYMAYKGHHTMGMTGIGLGIVLVIVGAAWWWMKDKSAPKAATPQPVQPAKTT